jgi:hypothetical protein
MPKANTIKLDLFFVGELERLDWKCARAGFLRLKDSFTHHFELGQLVNLAGKIDFARLGERRN